jgi:DNA polymerase (family 10)
VFRGERRVAGATEASVFEAVGLPFIEPELREDRGEFEAAAAGTLPRLLRLDDLRGDLHAHTDDTDGTEPAEAMVEAARRAGLEYVAITDHSKYLGATRGLNAVRLRKQFDRLERIAANARGITVLRGIEVDILESGELALPDSVLETLDLVVGAVHSHFDLAARKQTARLLRAIDHRCFSILAHPLCRLIGDREPIRLDMERVISACAARGCFLELNSQPQRLDLPDAQCQLAREHEVLVSVASDAHRGSDFGLLAHGVIEARRGWLEPSDVLNTRGAPDVRKLLRRTMR